MIPCDATFADPIAWIAEQLARVPIQLDRGTPLRRAVVLVAAERQAHAIRRYVCLERARPEQLAGVLFVRPAELAREILLRAGTVRRFGWEEVRRLRILQLFESGVLAGRLRYFRAEQLRSGQGYGDAFARTIADLEASGLDVATAFAVVRRLSASDPLAADRLHDVAVTWQAADADTSALATTAQVLGEAAVLLAAQPQWLAPLGPIFGLLTASPSTMVLRFLRALPECHIVLQEARPLRSETQRWRQLLTIEPPVPAAAVDTELQLVQRFLFALPEELTDPARPRSGGADGSVDLEEYPSIEEEIDATATWVTAQIEQGIPAEQIALIVPETDPYGALLADRLARTTHSKPAEPLRVYVAGGLSLAASPAGMRLQGVLNALARGLEAEATIRVLPWLRRGGSGSDGATERLSPSRAAAIVYWAGIVGGSPRDRAGVSEWAPRLLRRRDALREVVAQDLNEGPAATDPDEPEKRMDERARQEATRWLRDIEPILPAIIELQKLAEAVCADEAAATLWRQLRQFCERWLRMPPDPPTLLALLDHRLAPILADRIARATRGPAAVRLFIDVLHAERRPTARFGEPCIFVGTGAQAAGLSFATVRVLGLAEGALPHTPHDDPIVPDNLRARIEAEARAEQAEPDIVLPRLADRVLDDIHEVFRAVSGARTRLALSAPRQWVDRSDRETSGIMLEAATALGRGVQHEADEGDVPTAARLRAVYLNPGRTARQQYAAARPLAPRALLTAVLTAPSDATSIGVPAGWTAGAALALDQVWQRTRELRSDVLGRMDGIVTDAWALAQPAGLVVKRPISQSALVLLLTCPHRFLLERILYLKEPAARPSTDAIAPVDYGSLFHAAADRFFREAGAALCRREGSVEQWIARARAIAADEFEKLQHQYPMRGEDGIARERSRLLQQIEQLVAYEWQLPPRDFLASELSFGDPDAVRLDLDGGALSVWGAIDRVDRISPHALSLRDLKTGRVRDFGEDPINAGRDLQIGLYVLALEATGYGGAPVGTAAYVHPSAAQEPDRAFIGAELDVLRRHTRDWLAVARTLLNAGSFPRTPNPEDCTFCPFVPACGDGAQLHSAAKLGHLPHDHSLDPFVRFKRKRGDDEA